MGTAQTTHTSSSQIKICSVQTKLNKTRVIRAAMHDLLTSQCDRHAQNVFVNKHGQIRLIDNLQVSACEGACSPKQMPALLLQRRSSSQALHHHAVLSAGPPSPPDPLRIRLNLPTGDPKERDSKVRAHLGQR